MFKSGLALIQGSVSYPGFVSNVAETDLICKFGNNKFFIGKFQLQ